MQHADTSLPLHSPPIALFIVFDLLILCLFLSLLQYEFNINSLSKANLPDKIKYDEIQDLQRMPGRWVMFCTVKIQPPWGCEGLYGVSKAKVFWALKWVHFPRGSLLKSKRRHLAHIEKLVFGFDFFSLRQSCSMAEAGQEPLILQSPPSGFRGYRHDSIPSLHI